MTPEEAGELLNWIADEPARRERYRLAGGQRRRWDCKECGWATEAETGRQARANLLTCPVCCDHGSIADSGYLMPPLDFK